VDPVQVRLKQPRRDEAACHAQKYPASDPDDAHSSRRPHNAGGSRAERDADPDLPAALLYQERHDAVGADGAQSQAQETEDAGDPGQGAVREKSEADALFERLQVVDDEVRLDRRDPLTNENCRCPRAERRFETKKVDRVEARYRSSCLRSRSVAARRHQTCPPSAA